MLQLGDRKPASSSLHKESPTAALAGRYAEIFQTLPMLLATNGWGRTIYSGETLLSLVESEAAKVTHLIADLKGKDASVMQQWYTTRVNPAREQVKAFKEAGNGLDTSGIDALMASYAHLTTLHKMLTGYGPIH